jgi:cell wall-associated NlpC family hydrolase
MTPAASGAPRRTPDAVIDEALTWLRTPYHHEARVKGAGVDCGQFPAAVFEACGLIPKIEIAPYTYDWHMHRADDRYLGLVRAFFAPVESPAPADLALFKYGRAVAHGSIVIAWPLLVHAYLNAGAVVLDDGLANRDLAGRFAGFYRLKAWTGE